MCIERDARLSENDRLALVICSSAAVRFCVPSSEFITAVLKAVIADGCFHIDVTISISHLTSRRIAVLVVDDYRRIIRPDGIQINCASGELSVSTELIRRTAAIGYGVPLDEMIIRVLEAVLGELNSLVGLADGIGCRTVVCYSVFWLYLNSVLYSVYY